MRVFARDLLSPGEAGGREDVNTEKKWQAREGRLRSVGKDWKWMEHRMRRENGNIIYDRQEIFGQNICIVADSLLETFIAIYLKEASLSDKRVDLVLTDHIRQYRELSGRILESYIFNNVIPIEATWFERGNGEFAELYSGRLDPDIGYDTLIISEVDRFSRGFYSYLKHKNEALILNLLGEGILPYCGLAQLLKERKKGALSFREALYEYKAVITCNVERIRDDFNGLYELPAFNEAYLSKINQAFGYIPHQKVYENRIVFLEESYAADGCGTNDVDLLRLIAGRCSRLKIVLKKHPRSRDNRFSDMKNIEIVDSIYPLEIQILNGDYRNCVFICAYSGGVINPVYLFHYDIKAVMLSRLIRLSDGCMNSKWMHAFHRYIEDVILLDPHFIVPETQEELLDLVEKEDKTYG